VNDVEFSRPVRARHLPAKPITLEVDPGERDALARRLGVVAVHSLRAEVSLIAAGEAVLATGELAADLIQTCAISGDDFPVHIAEPITLRFVPPRVRPPEEDLELPADSADEIEFEGDSFDLGEAVAQTLALAIDPYATGPDADRVRVEKRLVADDDRRGPLADLLDGLKRS
jgi:hypothetical protein